MDEQQQEVNATSAAAMGSGDAVDGRNSQGMVIKPSGPVEQYYGPVTKSLGLEWPQMLVISVGFAVANQMVQMLAQVFARGVEKLKAQKAYPLEMPPSDKDAVLDKHLAFLYDSLSKRKDTRDDLRRLVQTLGYEGFAIRLAACYLKRFSKVTIEKYIWKWNQAWSQLLSDAQLDETNQEIKVIAAIALNWEQVEAEIAQRILMVASYCTPDRSIPDELLRLSVELDPKSYEKSLKTLVDLGLLEFDGDYVVINPVLAVFVRSLLQESYTPLFSLVNALTILMPNAPVAQSSPLLLLHAETIFSAAENYFLSHWLIYVPYIFRRSCSIDMSAYSQDLQSAFLSGQVVLDIQQGSINKAEALAREVRVLNRERRNLYGYTLTLIRLSEIASVRGSYSAAWTLSREALRIFEEMKERGGIAWVYLQMSDIAVVRSDYNHAGKLIQESLDIFEELAEKHGIALANFKQARAMRLMSKVILDNRSQRLYDEAHHYLDRALQAVDRALDITNEADNASLILNLQAERGRVFRDMGNMAEFSDPKEGLSFYRKSADQLHMALKSEKWNKVDAADTWHDLAQVLYALEDPTGANECLAHAESLMDEKFIIKPGQRVPDTETPYREFICLGKIEAFKGKRAIDLEQLKQGIRHFIMSYVYFTLSSQAFKSEYLHTALTRGDFPRQLVAKSLNAEMDWAARNFTNVPLEELENFTWEIRSILDYA